MNFSCFQLMQSLNVQVIWNVILTKYVSKDLVFLHVAESVVAKMLFVHQNFIKENANAFQDSVAILILVAKRVKELTILHEN